jgi:hypothetical protein
MTVVTLEYNCDFTDASCISYVFCTCWQPVNSSYAGTPDTQWNKWKIQTYVLFGCWTSRTGVPPCQPRATRVNGALGVEVMPEVRLTLLRAVGTVGKGRSCHAEPH